jgi:hypothetical protein
MVNFFGGRGFGDRYDARNHATAGMDVVRQRRRAARCCIFLSVK